MRKGKWWEKRNGEREVDLVFVGLDAADEEGGSLVEGVSQLQQRVLRGRSNDTQNNI